MNPTLPKMGRPSLSGLSVKLLGQSEYNRQLYDKKNPGNPRKKHWTGLSHKLLGHAAYVRAWQKMRKTVSKSATHEKVQV